MQVDEYYIPNRYAYHNNHWVHDIMVYGYDNEKQIYYITVYNEKFINCKGECTYSQLAEALKGNNEDFKEYDWIDRLNFYQYNPNGNYKFNVALVKLCLLEYTRGENSFYTYERFLNNSSEKVFGVKVYDVILQRLEVVKDYMRTSD